MSTERLLLATYSAWKYTAPHETLEASAFTQNSQTLVEFLVQCQPGPEISQPVHGSLHRPSPPLACPLQSYQYLCMQMAIPLGPQAVPGPLSLHAQPPAITLAASADNRAGARNTQRITAPITTINTGVTFSMVIPSTFVNINLPFTLWNVEYHDSYSQVNPPQTVQSPRHEQEFCRKHFLLGFVFAGVPVNS